MRPVFVGELNPYGPAPGNALLDYPVNSAGERLRRMVLGINSERYLACPRYNLCDFRWSVKAARGRAEEIRARHQGDTFVLLGRKVGDAFGCAHTDDDGKRDPWPIPSHGSLMRGLPGRPDFTGLSVVLIPHPSGLNRMWQQKGMLESVRLVLSLGLGDEFPLGEADRTEVRRG